MRRAPHVLLLFVFLLVTANLLPTARTQAAGGRDKDSPFGVVATVANRVRSDEIDRYVGLMREAGVQWNREEIFWDRVQLDPGGAFRWGGDESRMFDYDHAINAQANAGIHILGLLDYNPAWFKGQNPSVDEWIDAWGNYVYQTVVRYGRDGGKIKYWEIWNEPNLSASGYESGLYTVADYVRILGTARDAAKAADPEATIVLGGLASIWGYPPSDTNYDYFDYLDQIGQLGGWGFFDIVAVHPYRPDSPEGAPWRRDHPQTFAEEMRRLDALMDKYGSRPVWLTEMGWATHRGAYGVGEDQQAHFLARTYITALAQPNIEKIFWYDFRDDNAPGASYEQPARNEADNQLHFGMLRRSFPLDPGSASLRKPAFIGYRALTNALAGLTLQATVADGLRPDLPATYWYRFGGARRVDVVWNTDRNDQTVQIACGCREALVRSWNGRVRWLLQPQGGVVTLPLDEQGAPFYIEYDRPAVKSETFFSATGHGLSGAFRQYWSRYGGLARFGYPLTDELIEPDANSGRPRIVQYFERARFEHFPENSGTPYEVQLGRIGDDILRRQGTDWQTLQKVDAAPPECQFYAESGHSICAPFLARWQALGGLPLLGLPISEPFETKRADTGQPYTVQYFERARLEQFLEFAGTPNEVQLGLLGRELLTR